MTERWTFGEAPLAQTSEAAALVRRVSSLVLAMEGDDEGVATLISDLRRAEAALATRVPADEQPRVGPAAGGDGRVYLDHARDIGAYNPAFPEYDLEVDAEHEGSARGSVTFPLVFEGPPGIVHGGFLAVFFDCVVQHHSCDVGVAGRTTSLTLRYRRPTPILTALGFTIERRTADGRIRSTAGLFDRDRLLCEAEVEAVVGDRAALPDVSPRRNEA